MTCSVASRMRKPIDSGVNSSTSRSCKQIEVFNSQRYNNQRAPYEPRYDTPVKHQIRAINLFFLRAPQAKLRIPTFISAYSLAETQTSIITQFENQTWEKMSEVHFMSTSATPTFSKYLLTFFPILLKPNCQFQSSSHYIHMVKSNFPIYPDSHPTRNMLSIFSLRYWNLITTIRIYLITITLWNLTPPHLLWIHLKSLSLLTLCTLASMGTPHLQLTAYVTSSSSRDTVVRATVAQLAVRPSSPPRRVDSPDQSHRGLQEDGSVVGSRNEFMVHATNF